MSRFVPTVSTLLKQLYISIVMPQLEYAAPVLNSLSKSQIQTLERIQSAYTKFMFDYESPVTYPDRLDRLSLHPLSHTRDISDLCELYRFFKISLPILTNSIHFRNDQIYTRLSESSNVPISRCKNEQFRKVYFNRVVYSWNKLHEIVKDANTLLCLKKSLIIYLNDILESNFNVNDTCTWVHVCKCALCRQCYNVKPSGVELLGIYKLLIPLPANLIYTQILLYFYAIFIYFYIIYVYFIVHTVTVLSCMQGNK